MGGTKPRAVVSIAPSGEIHGYFESISQAAKMHGSTVNNVWKAINRKLYFRKMRWMYEEDYKQYWMEGRTSELAYNRRKEFSERVREGCSKMSDEQKDSMKKSKSEARKKWLREHPEYDYWVANRMKFKRVCCLSTGEEFESIKACAEQHGLNLGYLRKAINYKGGRYKDKVYVKI